MHFSDGHFVRIPHGAVYRRQNRLKFPTQKNYQKFEKFKERLEHFAKNHRAEIQKNPEFRRQFQSMCASIGVDPLASSRGFWADMLGVGDYYYELAVRVVEYCLANRNTLGGLIQMSVIAKYLGENPNDITIALKVSLVKLQESEFLEKI